MHRAKTNSKPQIGQIPSIAEHSKYSKKVKNVTEAIEKFYLSQQSGEHWREAPYQYA
jgi:hypothetical protein